MAQRNPTLAAINAAIDKVERYGLPKTVENVRANVEVNGLTLADAHEALRKHINQQIPIIMKHRGDVIVNGETRERKGFWACGVAELEEQKRIQEQSNDFDRVRMACFEAVIKFLREKQREFGYEVYPGLFHAEIDRIYAMHSLTTPSA